MSKTAKLYRPDGENDILSWIEELTDYTPQEVQESFGNRDLNQNDVRSSQIRTYSLFAEDPEGS